jgi:maltooligosyltrehalose trehalohydrolase
VNNFHQKIGAWYSPGFSEFILWAPLRQQAELVILSSTSAEGSQDRSIIYPMEKDEYGYWKTSIAAEEGARYLFRLDGKGNFPDPASISQPDGVHGASRLLNRAPYSAGGSFLKGKEDPDAEKDRGENSWQGMPLSNMIIYELHTGLFTNTHDFEGIINKLDYLSELGVNAIELMPLAQFPGESNWGYDGVNPFAIQHSYGGRPGFKELVKTAHAKDMAVIVDVVYNHLGPEGSYLQEFGPYFTDKYHTPWGRALNFDDAWCDGVRNYFLQNVCMWLEELEVDALRLDAVHAIYDFSANPFMRQLKELAIDIGQRTGRRKEIIAEMDLNDTKYINPPEKGGYGLDGQWSDEFHHALHALMTGERNGYYEDFGEIGHLEKAFRDSYVYNGNYSIHRKKYFGMPTANPFSQFVVFSQNHDQIGNRAKGDRLAHTLTHEQLKLAAATVLLSPYIPLLFMGEEYGEKNPFLFFTSFSDPDLIEGIRKGRATEFRHSHSDLPDPQAGDTFQRCLLSWKNSEGESAALFGYYRDLIAFRKSRPAMQGVTRDSMVVHPAKENILAFERKITSDHVYVWLNFNGREMTVKNETKNALNRVFGEQGPCGIAPGEAIHLPPYSANIFEIKS